MLNKESKFDQIQLVRLIYVCILLIFASNTGKDSHNSLFYFIGMGVWHLCMSIVLRARKVDNFRRFTLTIRKILAYRARGGQIVAFPPDYLRFRVRI